MELAGRGGSQKGTREAVVAARRRNTRVDIREARRWCPRKDRQTRPRQPARSHRCGARNNKVVGYRTHRPGRNVEAFVAGETAEGALVHVLRKLAIRGIA